ncbi:protease inhibitor I42 family protein [Gemmatimonadota bacterium]
MCEKNISVKHNGETIHLSLNQSLRIELPENPTTGYCWDIERADKGFELERLDFLSSPGGEDGTAGIRVFRAKSGKAGFYNLTLKLWRDWIGNTSIDQLFAISISVSTED